MQKDTEKLVQNTSWEKEFEKVMGCIPECANGLYEDVGCPAHGYDAMKTVKFFRKVLSNRENEIAEEVEKMKTRLEGLSSTKIKGEGTTFDFVVLAKIDALNDVLAMLKR